MEQVAGRFYNDKSKYISEIINIMYDDIFSVFFGLKEYQYNTWIGERLRYKEPPYYKAHKDKCPAKYIVRKALTYAKILTEELCYYQMFEEIDDNSESEKIVKSYLSRCKFIDFKRLDYIYTNIKRRDRVLSKQDINYCKEKIFEILKPQYILALHLYMKYHCVYDNQLFKAFYEMLGLNDINNGDIFFVCCETIGYAETLMSEVKNEIYDNDKKSLNKFCEKVFEDIISVKKQYKSFEKYYNKAKEDFESVVNKVLKNIEDEHLWNPKGPQNGKVYPTAIKNYIDVLKNNVKSKIFKRLNTTNGNYKKDEPNLRTMRRKSSKFIKMFQLEVPFGIDEELVNKITTCPQFLCDELWEKMKEYRSKDNTDCIIDGSRIRLMGRLYMIILLTYAFDVNNIKIKSNDCIKFNDILQHSLENSDVLDLLKSYSAITDNEWDKDIIYEILENKS